jgi:hypothetical protein
VDKAMIFFISHSVSALKPAMHAVSEAEKRRINSNDWKPWIKLKNRIKIKIPAVTRVEE